MATAEAQWKALHPNEGVMPVGYHGEGGSSSSGGSGDYLSMARDMMKFQQESAKPVIESFQAQIPEVQQQFAVKKQTLEAERPALEKRYQALLDNITGQQKVAEQSASIASSREFGRRGVSLQSGAYDQYLQNQLLPIKSAFASDITNIGLSREDQERALANQLMALPTEQSTAERAIKNQIAAAQAGDVNSALSLAQNMYNQQQQQSYQNQQLALAQRELEAKLASPSYEKPVALASNQVLIDPTTGKLIYSNRVSGGGGGTDILSGLQSIFND